MLTLNDGRSELWQWDTGRTLSVDADCSQVHFSNKVFGRSIDVDVVDGIAIIPDALLQTDKELTAWAFVGTPENGYTKISKVFKVNRRNKPSDYVFTPTEQTTLQEIEEKIKHLESIEFPVTSINNKTGDVELNADDVGAISQEDLQAATDAALYQAKESGIFDGADGHTPIKGVDYGTPDDISGISKQAADILSPDLNQIKDDLSEQLSPFGKIVQDIMVQGTSTNAKVDIACNNMTEGQTVCVSFDSYDGSATLPRLTLYVYDSEGNFTQIGETQIGLNASIKGVIPTGDFIGIRVFVGSLIQGEIANVGYTLKLFGKMDEIEETLDNLKKRSERTNYIVVSQDGSGDYTTISEAVSAVPDSNSEWVTIFIKNGIYEEVVINNTKQYIHYFGESRDGVIWLNKTGMYNKAPLLTDGDQIIENITFMMLDDDAPSTWTPGTSRTDEDTMLPGYALHIDNGRPSSAVLSTLTVRNCKMYSVAFPAVGMGLHRNQTVIFENCEFVREISKDEYLNNNYQGAFLCHDTTTNLTVNQNLIMKDCVCKCSKTSSMHLKFEYTDPSEVTTTFINNTLWCDETEQPTLTATWHNTSNPDAVAKLHGMSHGNNNTELNA